MAISSQLHLIFSLWGYKNIQGMKNLGSNTNSFSHDFHSTPLEKLSGATGAFILPKYL